jgi:hypothetical protein
MTLTSNTGKIELRHSGFSQIEDRYLCNCLFRQVARSLFNVNDEQLICTLSFLVE